MPIQPIKRNRRWWWIGLGLLTIVLRMLLGNTPSVIETYYSRGLFLILRTIFDYTFGLLPFPMLYALVIGLLFFLAKRFIQFVKGEMGWLQKIGQSLLSLVAFLSGLIFLFLFCWGFNYGRIPLEQQINIQPKPLKLHELKAQLDLHTPQLISQRAQIPNVDSTALIDFQLTEATKTTIRADLEKTLDRLGYPTVGEPRARILKPKGILLRISTAGFYLPFTGECNVDGGLHPLQLPFVLAHEYAHAYGITDEGSCNFLAYLSCLDSEDPLIQYAGRLSYWRYLAGNYRYFRRKEYGEFRKQLPKGLVADLNSINEYSLRYPDILPRVRDFAYDSYLKAQGVEEGIESYSRIIMLVKAWEER